VALGWAALLLSYVGGAAGFYLPGVAPKSYKMRENVGAFGSQRTRPTNDHACALP
jgi:hypothetical protein